MSNRKMIRGTIAKLFQMFQLSSEHFFVSFVVSEKNAIFLKYYEQYVLPGIS